MTETLKDKTILQVIPHLRVGGAEKTTLEITRALIDVGARAVVASEGGAEDNPLQADILAAGGEIIDLPVASKNPLTMFANINRLADVLAEYKVDILHARSRAPAWSSLAAARKTEIAFLTTYHAKVAHSPMLKRFYNSSLARGDLVIANSQFTAAEIMRAHKTPPSRLRVIARGCDVVGLAPENVSPEARDNMREKWGVQKNDFVILCPARITRWKGQHIALAALAELKTRAGDLAERVKLVCVGAGDNTNYISELKTQSAELNIKEQWVLAGREDNMPAAYAASDVVIAPSIEPEPFGRIVIEAQAAARPVIASDAGGFRETVGAKTGWLVAPADVSAWAAHFHRVLVSPAHDLQAMGAAGREFVCEHFTDDLMCARTLDVYRELIN